MHNKNLNVEKQAGRGETSPAGKVGNTSLCPLQCFCSDPAKLYSSDGHPSRGQLQKWES